MRTFWIVAAGALVAATAQPALAQKKYDTGASDTEIKLGQTMPYSGPASAYGAQGKAEVAYFAMINSKGGINGRKVNLLSLDDAYSPPKTVEQTRKLVESEGVLALVNTIGTATNAAVHKYLNQQKVPQILVSTGAAKWNDPKNFPWTTPGVWNYTYEGRVYGKHVVATNKNARIAILSQNDDAGRDYVRGFKEGLGDLVKNVVKEQTYEVADPTVDSQIIQLKSTGADTLFLMATPKFGAQAIRKVAELGWKPAFYISSVAASRAQTLVPAGVENAKGIVTATVLKEASDPSWANDPGMVEYKKFMAEWMKDSDPLNSGNLFGYTIAQLTAHILKNAGDDLTRANVLKQATNIKGLTLPLLLPGVTINVSPTNYATYDTFRTQRFNGERWELFGDPIKVE